MGCRQAVKAWDFDSHIRAFKSHQPSQVGTVLLFRHFLFLEKFMSDYKLIAFDMDGTLLNSKKTISPVTLSAIDRVFDCGKEAVLSTGRCIAELRDIFPLIPRLRYAVSTSGGLVYDIKERKSIYSKIIEPSLCNEIFSILTKRDVMLHILTAERSIVSRKHEENMEHFHMGIYKPMYDKIATIVDDPIAFIRENNEDIYKINLYHTSQTERDKSRQQLEKLGLEIVDSEITSIECSPSGVTKGTGLSALCDHLGFTMDKAIAVGDSDNDLDVLSKVGLAVAMGNANEKVKAAADIIVSDNDHDGCAEAVDIMLR